MQPAIHNISVPSIEDSVELDLNYPSVKDRYFKHYYYIPKNQVIKSSEAVVDKDLSSDINEPSSKKLKLNDGLQQSVKHESEESQSEKGDEKQFKVTGLETLVMTHSNKLCLVSLSPHHPVVRNQMEISKVGFMRILSLPLPKYYP